MIFKMSLSNPNDEEMWLRADILQFNWKKLFEK